MDHSYLSTLLLEYVREILRGFLFGFFPIIIDMTNNGRFETLGFLELAVGNTFQPILQRFSVPRDKFEGLGSELRITPHGVPCIENLFFLLKTLEVETLTARGCDYRNH